MIVIPPGWGAGAAGERLAPCPLPDMGSVLPGHHLIITFTQILLDWLVHPLVFNKPVKPGLFKIQQQLKCHQN